MVNTPDYRENYANSVQIRVNLWDFFLMFGTVNQTAADNVLIHNFQGVYLSPQQAKALLNILTQNISQYEATFGEIKLEPHGPTGFYPAMSEAACVSGASHISFSFFGSFALIVFVIHAPYFGLPYFWDELGHPFPRLWIFITTERLCRTLLFRTRIHRA